MNIATDKKSELTFTMAYKESKTKNGFFGIVREVPGAASQASTLEELRINLADAVHCIFESNKLDRSDSNIIDDCPMQEELIAL